MDPALGRLQAAGAGNHKPIPGALVIGLVAVLLVTFVPRAAAQILPPAEEQAVLQFQRSVDQYVFLHRRIERRLVPVDVSSNPETIVKTLEAMAWAIRAARPDAQQGDVIAPDAQEALRARIARALRRHVLDEHDGELEEASAAAPETLRVNGTFAWKSGTQVWRCVLDVLPQLPPELLYRMVADNLVLVDVHASLIVNILPHAFVETTFR